MITGCVLPPPTLTSIRAEPSTRTWRSSRRVDLERDAVAVAVRRRGRRARGRRGAAGAWRGSRARRARSTVSVGRLPSAIRRASVAGVRVPTYPQSRHGKGDDSSIPEGPRPPDGAGGLGARLAGRPLRRHPGGQPRALQGGGRRGARRAPPRGRRADGPDARPDEGRGDEDRPARLVHRHGVPAAGVPRALPGAALRAAHLGAADAVEEGGARARGGVGRAGRGAVRGLRAGGRRGRLDRPGAPGRALRRPPGGGEDPVPRRGRGDRGPTCRTPG